MRIAGRIGWTLPLAMLAASASLSATNVEDDEPELSTDLIHSDLPLWGSGDQVWPQNFSDSDGSFGCTSRVAWGDWRFTHTADSEDWLRLENYGVFHCATIERWAERRDELDDSKVKYSFIIMIGSATTQAGPLELWAIQTGTRPGSEYTLLSRTPGVGIINSFTVLQRECPRRKTREGPKLGIWLTSYCAINSKSELIAMARQMATKPPLGTIELIEGPKTEQSAVD